MVVKRLVTLTLAHPLSADQARRRRAVDDREYNTGDQITVPHPDAVSIINAGFAAGVDPGDPGAVAAALTDPGADAGSSDGTAAAPASAPAPATAPPSAPAASAGSKAKQ